MFLQVILKRDSSRLGNSTAQNFTDHRLFATLLAVSNQLSSDEEQHADVRRCIASGFAEICTILSQDSHKHLREIFNRLLSQSSDSAIEIFDPILSSIDTILLNFSLSPQFNKQDLEFNEILFIILKKLRMFTRNAQSTRGHRMLERWLEQMIPIWA